MARGGTDTGSIIKLVLLGGGAYFLYDWWTKRTPAVATPPPVTGTQPPATGFNSLDATYQRLATAVGSVPFTADQFNYYLQRELPAGKSAPDPAAFLPAGVDRNATMTLAQYWGAVAPKLRVDLGMSGLGFYEGLYNVMTARRS